MYRLMRPPKSEAYRMRVPSQLQVGWQCDCLGMPRGAVVAQHDAAWPPRLEMSISTRSSTSSPTRHGVDPGWRGSGCSSKGMSMRLTTLPLRSARPTKGIMAFWLTWHVGGDGLRAVGGDGAVVAGAAVVEEDVAILRPELVADRVLLGLAEAGLTPRARRNRAARCAA